MVVMMMMVMRQDANVDPRHHMVMMMVVMMMAHTDGHLCQLFRGVRRGCALRLFGFQGRKRIWHGIEQLPVACGIIDRVPLHFGGIRASDCRDRSGSSQKSGNFLIHCPLQKGVGRDICALASMTRTPDGSEKHSGFALKG
jgi:hypothetical protein